MRNIVIFSLVAFAILLCACIMPGANPQVNTPVIQEQPANETPVAVPPKNLTNVSQVQVQIDAECLEAQNILQRDQCFSDLASEENDVKICDKIYSISTRDVCLDKFSSTDSSVCEKISDAILRQNCYYSNAIRLNDTNYCTNIGDEELKTQCLKALSPPCSFEKDEFATMLCYALEKKDYTLCRTNQCFYAYAIKTNSTDACNLISGELAMQGACKASVTNNGDYCYNLPQEAIQDYCYEMTAYTKNDSYWCGRAKEGSEYGNRCYLTFAIDNSNPNECASSAPETARDECYLDYADAKNDPSVCPKVINSLNRNKCMITTALQNANPAACNGLPYYDKRNCYNLVITGATPIYSADSCASVDDELWQVKCYTTAAQQQKDSSICMKIQDASSRAECTGKFS